MQDVVFFPTQPISKLLHCCWTIPQTSNIDQESDLDKAGGTSNEKPDKSWEPFFLRFTKEYDSKLFLKSFEEHLLNGKFVVCTLDNPELRQYYDYAVESGRI